VISPHQAFRNAVFAALGHAPDVIEPGRWHRFATNDRRGDDAGWCRLFDDLRGGAYGCHRRGIRGTWAAAEREQPSDASRRELARRAAARQAECKTAQAREWAANAERNAQLWAQCVPVEAGDPVDLYLRRRGLADAWPLPDCLRLHPALPYWHAGKRLGAFPAMVAPLVTSNGRYVTLHRTYLTRYGNKADVPTPKKLTRAAGVVVGAFVPLHVPLRGCVGVAEGVETALAARCASAVPTVAAYCAAGLSAWQWPPSVQRLAVFADADAAGREAAMRLRVRAVAAGLRCDVHVPSTEGADWCDIWAARQRTMQAAGAAR
jgi:phage/plasmid primase-like uncharacterized protein